MRRALQPMDPDSIIWRKAASPWRSAAVRRAHAREALRAKTEGRPYRRPGPREYLDALLELERGAR